MWAGVDPSDRAAYEELAAELDDVAILLTKR